MVDGNFDLSWQPLAKELGIKVVPTFKILKQGKILKEVTGAKFDDLFTAMEDVRSSWTTIMLRIHMFQIDYPKIVRSCLCEDPDLWKVDLVNLYLGHVR